MNITTLPITALDPSPQNVRKTAGTSIAELAANIRAVGMLHCLVVRTGTGGRYEVVDGSRRLAALRQLIADKQLPATFEAPCNVLASNTDDGATEASLSANTMREAMHPADQFEAFKAMIERGKTRADTAASFGVTEEVVRQRLKLANVAAELLQVYRDGDMDLEQLQALAITDDHDAQRNAWFNAQDYQRSPHDLRQRLTKNQVRASNCVARFVGIAAYEAAGGAIHRDLFSSHDEAFLVDGLLLERLANEKLEALAQREREAGWNWVEARLALDYSEQSAYGAIECRSVTSVYTPEQTARLEAIDQRLAEIDDIDPDTLDDDARDAITDEHLALQDEVEGIESTADEIWPDAIKAQAGVLIYIDRHNGLTIERGRLKPGQKANATGEVTGKTKAGKQPKAKTPQISQDLLQRLELHRAAAIREAIDSKGRLAIELLAAHLIAETIHGSGEHLLDLRATNVHEHTYNTHVRGKQWADLGRSTARLALDDSVKGLREMGMGMPKKQADVLPWLAKLSDDGIHDVLTTCTVLMLKNITGKTAADLATKLDVNMATRWKPELDAYLAIVPKQLVLEAVAEARGKPAAAALASLKKDALVAAATKQLAGTGWLPKVLRGPNYALNKQPAPAAKKQAASKTTATKKPATKKAPAKKTPSKAKAGA